MLEVVFCVVLSALAIRLALSGGNAYGGSGNTIKNRFDKG